MVTGDIRRVRGVDAWVNPENTDMMMARVHENSVSASIRYEGAALDDSGRVVADALARAVRHRRAGRRRHRRRRRPGRADPA